MNIETLKKGAEIVKNLEQLERMKKDALVGNLFLSPIRKSWPHDVLLATVEVLRDRIQLGIDELNKELAKL
tara:strand:+ start:222 stop:434 length:213 start_codon:yes stop_codon:yes gene_type:complete